MLLLTMLSDSNEDVAEHNLAVSVIAICFGKHLGYNQTELKGIGLSALLHDIGHFKVDNRILDKYGKLNEVERKAVEQHPKHGFDINTTKSDLTPSCVEVIYNHHERLEGSGYPRGLERHSITPITQLISLVDVSESKTKQQSFRKGSPIVYTYKALLAHY